MPKTRITKRAVDAAVADGRDRYLWDAEVAGFGLKVAAGGTKTYLVQYRMGGRGSPTRRCTIGRHGSPWTPEQARQEARRLLAEIAHGIDPAEARASRRHDLTVGELCNLYLSEGCTTKKPSTLKADRGRIEWHIRPLLGRKKVTAVTRGDVDRLLRDVTAGRTTASAERSPKGGGIAKGGRGAASQSVILLRAMLNFAIERGLRQDNPAAGVKVFKVRKIERFLTSDELARLGDALSAAERNGANRTILAAIRLLLLTGCRRSEILSLRWDYVDAERSCLRLPDSKSGAKVVPVGGSALAVLAGLPRVEGNPHVIVGEIDGSHLVNIDRMWRSIRQAARLPDLRLHDLRHSFASVGACGGDSLLVIGKLLGHSQASTTQRYAHLSNDPLKAAADRISAAISAAMAEKRQPE